MRRSSLPPATAVVAALALFVACSSPSEPTSKESAPVASVAIQAATASLPVGSSLALTVVLLDDSRRMLTNRAITFSSSNESVATVGATGVVQALTVGVTTISASSEGKSGSMVLTVCPTLEPCVDSGAGKWDY
jgi:uncharacterized protein YjdB